MEAQAYKSPARKLVRFFEWSRDNWKHKYQKLQRERKKLQRLRKKVSNQVRAVEKSREHWKDVARQEQQRAQQLERELEDLKRAGC